MTVDAKTTGSRTVDRVLTYSTVQKGKAKAGEFIESSSVLSTYVAPAAQKSVAMASNVASATSGYVPGVVKTPVKNVVAKVDDLGDRTLQRLEDVTARSQEKLQKYVKDTLPLDSDDENVEDSSLNVKERVVVNGKKAIEKVVPGSVVTVAVKSVSATKAAASAASTAYGAMTRENIVGAYNQITVDNAKGLTKDTVKGAYNQITKENAKAVVKGTADAAKTVTKASIDTTKAVVGTSLATTKAVVDTSLAATQAGYGAAKSVAGAGVKVAGATYSTAVALKDYAMGSKPADVPVAEPETPKAA